MRLALVARHGQSLLNVADRVNGNPALDQGLSELGRAEAEQLAGQLAAVAIDLLVVSEFPRAQETAALALAGRNVPRLVDPGLDDVKIGNLEGQTLAEYHAWKAEHTRSDRFPGGESLVTRRSVTPMRTNACSRATRRRSSSSATRSPCVMP